MNSSFAVSLPDGLPPYPTFVENIRRAPSRGYKLNEGETKLALKNILRYIPQHLHEQLIPEFLDELRTYGRIYAFRYRPAAGDENIKAKPINQYEGILEARAIQLMMDNNVDFEVALYPYELVTYGSNGRVCQNWIQFRLIKQYLRQMTNEQTLVVQSGHPMGLFPTHRNAPRVISTNALMVGIFDNPADYDRAAALGVANYGQMTAGGWMYIGPQGIVHGTYITILNAARKYLGILEDSDLTGILYLTSGLGGMSGAQAKAIEIANGIGVIAEVDRAQIETRHQQGWVGRVSDDLDEIFRWVHEAKTNKESLSIAYHGNIIDIWQHVVDNNISVELASDQTSCHNPYGGGYTPYSTTYEEAKEIIHDNPEKFEVLVDRSLKRHFGLIQTMAERGTYFWDYGNSFLKAVYDAGAVDVAKGGDPKNGFIFPSYVEDIMGPICFDYGYGPFRWVCTSGDPSDLHKTDLAAMSCIDINKNHMERDNYQWIRDAEKNDLVVGSQARILYADAEGRVKIALKFNEMIRNGEIGPIMMGRDHHDTGGTDSPFRETSNIYDGSNIMTEMSHQSWVGNAVRGMTMCVLSNGGGVGIGKAINGGFGLVLDGSTRIDNIIKSAVEWDVLIGVARRAWSRKTSSQEIINGWNNDNRKRGFILLPEPTDENFLNKYIESRSNK